MYNRLNDASPALCGGIFEYGGTMKISARNQFKGRILSVKEGAVNGIVIIDIGGGNKMSATISMDSIRELGLKAGGEAYAIVKATSVMVGVDS
jgi:molybdopterin-binding protein